MIAGAAPVPKPTRCPKCGNVAAEIVCHLCKTPKPEWFRLHPGDTLNVIASVAVLACVISGVIA